jgi:periplasmic protein CpxP/Spy
MTKIRTRTLAVATALLALCTGPIFAQDTPPSGPPAGGPPGGHMRMGDPERELHMLTHVLTLTPEQQTGVKAILEQQTTQMQALRAKNQGEAASDTTEARQARMTQMAQIREEGDTKINALLDDSQKKLFADWIARRKAAMERRQQGGAAPPPSSEN